MKASDLLLSNLLQLINSADRVLTAQYTNLTALLSTKLHSYKGVDNIQCTAMLSHMNSAVQIPCDTPILRDWICKVEHLNKNDTAKTYVNAVVGSLSICQSGQFMCNNGECIADVYVCDGQMDCRSGEDEHSCNVCNLEGKPYEDSHFCQNICGTSNACTCHFLYHKYNSSGCVPYTNPPDIKEESCHMCLDGSLILQQYVSDLRGDATSRSKSSARC